MLTFRKSAQEPRLTAHMSKDEIMLQAYKDKKDLYAVIASMSFDKPYEQCKEFYDEFTEVIINNDKVIAGTDESHEYSLDNNCVILPTCYIVNTDRGNISVKDLLLSDRIISDIGPISILNIERLIHNNIHSCKIMFKE